MTPSSTPLVWFITGASRGIGARLVTALLARGDAVVATARDPSSLTRVHGTDHPRLLAVALDVTVEAQALAAVAQAHARFGHIDVLVNNAGHGLLGAVEEASAAEIEHLFATNVFGLLHVTRAVLPGMRARRRGHVMNLSSLGGHQSSAGFGPYCATKFAVEALTEALHDELAPLGIHVTAIEPGYFRTDFLDDASLQRSPTVLADYAESSGRVREAVLTINHRQPGNPDLIAPAVLALAALPNPPLRLPLGSDTVAAIRAKHAFVETELAAWESVARSTDFAASA